ncbi:MAG: acyl-CoA thioesterase [Planctomycetes bacterium]|nr:acyl-CoA thioesterase [Planctomycetota bacterium]
MTTERGEIATTIRVRYSECDSMGYLHHGRYFDYLEVARLELLRAHGVRYRDCEAEGVFFVLAKLSCRYLRPIRNDDQVVVRVWIQRITGARIDHAYEMEVDGVKTTEASTTLACVGRDGKPRPMPGYFWTGESDETVGGVARGGDTQA